MFQVIVEWVDANFVTFRIKIAHWQLFWFPDFPHSNSIENFLERLGYGPTNPEGQRLLETIRTDGWRSYGRAVKDKNLSHYKIVLKDPKAAGKLLPWVHRVISNAKAVIRGSHRGVSLETRDGWQGGARSIAGAGAPGCPRHRTCPFVCVARTMGSC